MPSLEPCILVVDDDPDFRSALTDILSDEGYPLLQAANGREAFELLASHRPRLMLVDLMMPVMSGLEFLQKVRRDHVLKTIPVIVMTAANDAMLTVRLDLPVVYKGDLRTVLQTVRSRLGADPS
jgi:CheY-like chemotaxis protein